MNGKFKDETRWISREDFFRLKNSDPYIRYCWSFGYDAKDYLYSREIEPWKKALHYARVFHDTSLFKEIGIDTDGSSKDIKEHYTEYAEKYQDYIEGKVNYKSNYFLRLESLQRLQSLGSVTRLREIDLPKTAIQTSRHDYEDVSIPTNSVIYCDIPYKGTNTKGYLKIKFDYPRFYDWCKKQKELVVISEKDMPTDFTCVAERPLNHTFSATNNHLKVKEKLFVPNHQLSLYKQMIDQ